MKWLYKYPQRAFPYDDLVKTNRDRSRNEPEYELVDTGVFYDLLRLPDGNAKRLKVRSMVGLLPLCASTV